MRHALLATLALFAACGPVEPALCAPDEVRACACPDGRLGTQRCAPTQDRYEGCACAGSSPCPDRTCGVDPRTGVRCGDCAPGYACGAAGRCAAE